MAGFISDDVIDEIRSRSDIVDVIGSYIQLKRAGGNSWKACCPFHNEKTPSFHVQGDKQLFHCFGCGKGGDVFRFVMERENISFPEAAHILASRSGVIIPENSPGMSREEGQRAANTRERLYALNEEFARFFEINLHKHPEWPAAQYLQTRHLTEDAIKTFRIGAAPDEWDGCLRYGLALGFSEKELLSGGIVRQHEATGRLYDHFKGRLTFAIWNEQGKVVGFSARSLEAKPQSAKYVNTAETPVFKKGQLLYALPFARKAMQERKQAILCEGQLDTIAFHRADFCEAVAPQGTGFTADQARILRRYADRVLLAFDADNAGQKAIRSALELLLVQEFEIKAITIPGGKDPDELFATGGAEAVAAAVDNAASWIKHLCGNFAKNYDMGSPAGRGRAVSELVDLIMLSPSPVSRELFTEEAASELGVSGESIRAEISRRMHAVRRRFAAGATPQAEAPVPVRRSSETEQALLTLLELALQSEAVARRLADELPSELPGAGWYGKMLNLVIAHAMNGEYSAAIGDLATELNMSESSGDITPEQRGTITRMLVEDHVYEEAMREKMLTDCLASLHAATCRLTRTELLEALRQCGDPAEKMRLLRELSAG